MTKTLLSLLSRKTTPVEADTTSVATAAINARMQRMLASASESQARAGLPQGLTPLA